MRRLHRLDPPAPAVVVFVIPKDGGRPFDIGRMAQNLMIATNAEGLASCPVSFQHQDKIGPLLGLPDTHEAPNGVEFGHPGDEPEENPLRSPRIPLDELVQRERWQDQPLAGPLNREAKQTDDEGTDDALQPDEAEHQAPHLGVELAPHHGHEVLLASLDPLHQEPLQRVDPRIEAHLEPVDLRVEAHLEPIDLRVEARFRAINPRIETHLDSAELRVEQLDVAASCHVSRPRTHQRGRRLGSDHFSQRIPCVVPRLLINSHRVPRSRRAASERGRRGAPPTHLIGTMPPTYDKNEEPAAQSRDVASPRAVVERYVAELVNQGDFVKAGEILAEDCRGDEPAGEVAGRDAIVSNLERWRDAFPGMHLSADDLIVDGERVVWEWRLEAVHVSGRPVDVRGMIVFRVRDGRIVGYRGVFDRGELERQLAGS